MQATADRVWILADVGGKVRSKRRLVTAEEALAAGWPHRYEYGDAVFVSIEDYEARQGQPTSYQPPVVGRGAGYRLSKEEKRKIHLQTGIHVEDYAHYKRICRERGLRDQEKGERAFDAKVAIAEWVKSGGRPEDKPVGNCSIQPREKSRESLQAWKERARRRGDRW